MARFKIEMLTRAELQARATPDNGNLPEVLPWALYDTQPITTAVTTQASFFVNVNADKTLSNMEGAGSLPDPQYFVLQYINADILFPGVSTDAATKGDIDDVCQILYGQRATFTLQLSNKSYGPYPLSYAHASGGPVGGISSTVATVSQQYATNGVQDGGWYVGGQITIPPKVAFSVLVQFAGAPTLKTSPLNLRMSLVGTLYRRVL